MRYHKLAHRRTDGGGNVQRRRRGAHICAVSNVLGEDLEGDRLGVVPVFPLEDPAGGKDRRQTCVKTRRHSPPVIASEGRLVVPLPFDELQPLVLVLLRAGEERGSTISVRQGKSVRLFALLCNSYLCLLSTCHYLLQPGCARI